MFIPVRLTSKLVFTAELNKRKKLFPEKPCRFAHVKSTGNTVYCWLLCTSLTKITPPRSTVLTIIFLFLFAMLQKVLAHIACSKNTCSQPSPSPHCRPCIAVIDMQVVHCTVHTSYFMVDSISGPPYLFLKGFLTKENKLKIKSSMGYFWLNVAHVLLSFLTTNFSQHLYWDCIQRETGCMRPCA